MKALLISFLLAIQCASPWQGALAMIFRPADGSMWDPSVIWHNGKYHAFMMYDQAGKNGLLAGHCLLATSEDGVHWREEAVILEERELAEGTIFYKCFVAKCGDRFIMNHGIRRHQGQDTMRFYESKDLRHWEYLTSTEPDARWYSRERWDHMYMLPKDETDSTAGYWGYVVAVPKQGFDLPAMMESSDGLKWVVLPPARTEWGAVVPRSHFEYGGCERIGGRYYLIGGRFLDGGKGYGMFTFVADGPQGPFRPDAETFQLCGSKGQEVTWLAAWVRGENEILVSNYASMHHGDRSPWLLPLRKPVIDKDDHLRLGWWKGNEAIKGQVVSLQHEHIDLDGEGKPNDFDTVYLDLNCDRGLVLEGTIRAQRNSRAPAGLAHASVGFLFEETPNQATVLELGVGPSTEREARVGLLTAASDGRWSFEIKDVVGQGCAGITGIEDGTGHSFRLLHRSQMFELYVDDLLVQTYTHAPGSGRIGFLACGAKAWFTDLRAWAMTFPSLSVSRDSD